MKLPITRLLASFLILALALTLPLAGQEQAADLQADDKSRFDWLSVQGEYDGNLEVDGHAMRMSAQVIALGEDKFSMVVYLGGLPGSDSDSVKHESGESKIEDDQLVFEKNGKRMIVREGELEVQGGDGQVYGTLKKIRRESDTLGKHPPDNAIVLFDGSENNQFVARQGGDPVEEGWLCPGVNSKPTFGDCHLHIEFKLPFEPERTGQARGNSGVYLQGRYEVQMLDSFGLSGEHNECGGIYSVKKPDINMCYPPESWQTYDIDFTAARFDDQGEKTANARMTVYHNGVLIHDDVEVPGPTTAAPVKETADPGYIYLQDHGSPVRYRNIWVIEK